MMEAEIPDISPPDDGIGLITYFWDMRAFKGDAETRLQLQDIEAWERHTDIILEKWERAAIVGMDRALGHATMEMLKFHQTTVSKIKTKPAAKNKDRQNNGRRS